MSFEKRNFGEHNFRFVDRHGKLAVGAVRALHDPAFLEFLRRENFHVISCFPISKKFGREPPLRQELAKKGITSDDVFGPAHAFLSSERKPEKIQSVIQKMRRAARTKKLLVVCSGGYDASPTVAGTYLALEEMWKPRTAARAVTHPLYRRKQDEREKIKDIKRNVESYLKAASKTREREWQTSVT